MIETSKNLLEFFEENIKTSVIFLFLVLFLLEKKNQKKKDK